MFKTMAIEQLVVKALREAVSRIAKKVSRARGSAIERLSL